MRNFYKSLYLDVKNIKNRALIFASLVTIIYIALTLNGSHLSSILQAVCLLVPFLAGASIAVTTITTAQHGLHNQRSIVYSTLALFVLLILSAIQGSVSLLHGQGLVEQVLIRDSTGTVSSAQLTLQPFVLILILAIMWVASLEISNKIERKQKAIKGIQNKNLFK